MPVSHTNTGVRVRAPVPPASPAARGFGPRTPGEAVPGRAPGTYASPLGERLANLFMPWRNRFAPNPVRKNPPGWQQAWCLLLRGQTVASPQYCW